MANFKKRSKAEETVWLWLRYGCADISINGEVVYWVREHRFHPKRQWRFDFAMPELMLAVEIEGVLPNKFTGHTSLSGYAADCEKYNAAAILGWCVIRGTQAMVNNGRLYSDIESALKKVKKELTPYGRIGLESDYQFKKGIN